MERPYDTLSVDDMVSVLQVEDCERLMKKEFRTLTRW
jgi:hypothetical protein